jgi:hypothetical protein
MRDAVVKAVIHEAVIHEAVIHAQGTGATDATILPLDKVAPRASYACWTTTTNSRSEVGLSRSGG